MAKNSKSLDGDWQGDGWGIAWQSRDLGWNLKKSVHPIWDEEEVFSQIPKTRLFFVHARSSSFLHHKKVLAYNQPFICDPFVFVFNGLLREVSFPYRVAGNIGSQKIWKIFTDLLQQSSPKEALLQLV